MSKTTIIDEVLAAFNALGKSHVPMWQICSKIKKIREKNNRDVGDFNCLKSYIRWSILDNSGGRGTDLLTIKVEDGEELVGKKDLAKNKKIRIT